VVTVNKALSLTLIFLISASFLLIFSPVSVSELVEDSWNIKTPRPANTPSMPSGVTVVLDNKIYSIGGDPTLVYDPKTDVWTTLASIPTPRTSPLVAVCQAKFIA